MPGTRGVTVASKALGVGQGVPETAAMGAETQSGASPGHWASGGAVLPLAGDNLAGGRNLNKRLTSPLLVAP